MTPRRIATHQLRDPRQEHQLEEEQPYQPADHAGGRPLPLAARQPPRRRVQKGEQPRLQEQAVPLKPEERLSHHAEREITPPQQRQRRRPPHPPPHHPQQRRAPPTAQPETSSPPP